MIELFIVPVIITGYFNIAAALAGPLLRAISQGRASSAVIRQVRMFMVFSGLVQAVGIANLCALLALTDPASSIATGAWAVLAAIDCIAIGLLVLFKMSLTFQDWVAEVYMG